MPIFRKKKKTKPHKPKRPWPITAVALLLLFQGLGLLGVGIYDYPFNLLLEMENVHDFYHFLLLFLPTAVYGLVGLVILLASLDTFRMAPRSWINAMLLQGIILLSSLIQYFGSRPQYLYPIMIYTIFVVLYLHYSGTPQGFRFVSLPDPNGSPK
jgi:hypothetical protein